VKYRQLGSTGLELSEIGFGGWGIGGVTNNTVSYGQTDETESLKALRKAFELGVTFYDTADLYGEGRSERLIGQAFKKARSKVVIASKVTLVDLDGTRRASGEHIRKSLEGSLKRLETDYLDLYQLFDPAKVGMDYLKKDARILQTLQDLVKEGKIRAYGISARSPDDALFAINTYGFKSVQVNFNLLDQRAGENGLMEACSRQQVGLIIRTPLCFGFLTGAYAAGGAFKEGDHRNQWAPEQRALWADAHQVFSEVRTSASETPGQWALRFCLSYPAVACAIPGMLKEAHALENTKASDLGVLSKEERKSAEAIYKKHNFFIGQHVLPQ